LFKEWSEQGKNPHEEYKKLEATNHTDAFTYNPDLVGLCHWSVGDSSSHHKMPFVIGEVISRPALPDKQEVIVQGMERTG
jgi:hypothetical protein